MTGAVRPQDSLLSFSVSFPLRRGRELAPGANLCLLRYNSLQLFIGQASSLISFINPFYLFPIFCSHLIWIHVAKTKCWIFKGASDHSWRVFSFVTISDTISPFPSVTSPPVNLSWGNKLFRSKGGGKIFLSRIHLLQHLDEIIFIGGRFLSPPTFEQPGQ